MRSFFGRLTHRRVENQKCQPDTQCPRNAAETGLKIIYESTRCHVDIVAIHGDGGHYKHSWTHPDSQVFWLRDLLPSIVPESRILSFGYSASKAEFIPAEEICQSLVRDLSEVRQEPSTIKGRPIIFLAHSFGVLLLKMALAPSTSSDVDNIVTSTRAIMFFGSPPDVGRSLQNLMSSFPSPSDAVPESSSLTAMKKDLIWLQDAESRYNVLEKKGQFEVTYFLESAGGDQEPTDSNQEKYIRLKKSHGMMIRFSGAEDEDFCLVNRYIQQIVSNYLLN